MDVTLPAEKVSSFSDAFFASLNKTLLKIKSILLVENVVESVKVGEIISSNTMMELQNLLDKTNHKHHVQTILKELINECAIVLRNE